MGSVSKIREGEGKMIAYILAAVAVATLAAIGIGAYRHTDEPDGKIEELAETGIERVLEEKFGLEKGTLEGRIDLTPSSDEKQV